MSRSRFSEAISESLRFAAAIGAFLLLEELAPDIEGMTADAIASVIQALLAGVLSFLVLDILLGRTVVRAEWTIDNRKAADRQSVIRLSAGEALPCHVSLEGERLGLPFRVVYALARQPALQIRLRLRPAKTLTYIKQRPAGNAHFQRNTLTLTVREGLYAGEVAWCEFTSQREETAKSGNKVRVTATISSPSVVRFLLPLLVRVDSGVDHLLVEDR